MPDVLWRIFRDNPQLAEAVPASGVTSKPANGGHFKTGQRKVAWD
jgi:hypothetical protein